MRFETHIMDFSKLDRSVAIIVFDDGTILHYDNENNAGGINIFPLSIPFDRASQVIFEPHLGIICMENENAERVFF